MARSSEMTSEQQPRGSASQRTEFARDEVLARVHARLRLVHVHLHSLVTAQAINSEMFCANRANARDVERRVFQLGFLALRNAVAGAACLRV